MPTRDLLAGSDRAHADWLADTTLRTYADALLHFLRWWESVHHTDEVTKDALTESTLLDYVRFQSSQERELTGATINQRVAIVDRALRIAFPGAPGQIAPALQSTYWQRAPMGIGKPRPALKPIACQDCQTNHRAFVRGRSGAILVQLSELSGPGDRGTDAAARASLAGGPGSAAGRLAVVGIADPGTR